MGVEPRGSPRIRMTQSPSDRHQLHEMKMEKQNVVPSEGQEQWAMGQG